MDFRTAQGLLITVLCAWSVYYAMANTSRLQAAPWLKTLQYIQVLVLLYIGAIYFLSAVRSLTDIETGLTMEHYRPGIMLLVITIFAEKLWRYRAGAR